MLQNIYLYIYIYILHIDYKHINKIKFVNLLTEYKLHSGVVFFTT